MKGKDPRIHKVLTFLKERFGIPLEVWERWTLVEAGGDFWLTTPEAASLEGRKLRRRGIRLVRAQKKGYWKLTTAAMHVLQPFFSRNVLEVGAKEAEAFIRGEDLHLETFPEGCEPGQVVVIFKGDVLGSGLLFSSGKVKNQIPSGNRLPRPVIVK